MALTDPFVRNVKPLGGVAGEKYTDGQGLYLLVKAAGKYWRMNYRFGGKQKTLALGVYPAVPLLIARQRRDAARAQVAQGVDPGVEKQRGKLAVVAGAQNTFEVVGRAWLAKTAGERMTSTHHKVTTWLEKDVFPWIGKIPISTLTSRDVLAALRKMEARGALDSVHRVKQICGQICRYAVAEGSAGQDVTRDLKGALKAADPGHFAALTEPRAVAGLLRAIHAYDGLPGTVAALKLLPLLFVRPGELRGAEWSEIDLDAGEWNIPIGRMKLKKPHLVPLSRQAVAILRGMQAMTGQGRFVFPSVRTGDRPMSENTLNAALRGMGYAQEVHTAHGFRATARTILDEVLQERVDLIEHQLAHAVKDPNGNAYNRTAHLPARVAMMQRWADYLDRLRVGVDIITKIA